MEEDNLVTAGFSATTKKVLVLRRKARSHKPTLTRKNKPLTSNFKELASQRAKCLPCSKRPVKRPCNFSGDDKLGDADSGSTVRETNPHCTFISIPEGSHLTVRETEHCGRSASMSALLKNGPGSLKSGESGP